MVVTQNNSLFLYFLFLNVTVPLKSDYCKALVDAGAGTELIDTLVQWNKLWAGIQHGEND